MGQIQTKNFIPHYLPLTTSKMSDIEIIDVDQRAEDQIMALNLQLLNHELPDAEQEIVDQNLGRPLETFTCFAKLPYELRHMIWDFMLPRRRVVDFKPFLNGLWDHKSQPKLPIGLFVNHESRTHFLKKYSIFFQCRFLDNVMNLNTWPSPYSVFCLDPKVDLVRIDSCQAFGDCLGILDLFKQNPECLEKCSKIEVTRTSWDDLHEICEGIMSGEYETNNFFTYFTSLRTIHLTEDPYWADKFRHTYCEKAYDGLLKLIKHERKGDLAKEPIPAIVMHKYRRNKVRSDHSFLHDGAMPYPWNEKWPAILQPPEASDASNSRNIITTSS